MKKIIISMLVIFLFTSCEKEFYGFDEMGNKNTDITKSTSTPPTTTTKPPTTTPPTTTTKPPTTTSCSSRQCSGTTKKGARCKNTTTNCSGRCYLH